MPGLEQVTGPEITGYYAALPSGSTGECLEALQALAHTIAHELAQPLTVLEAEIQFATVFGETPDQESWQRMEQAINYISERLRLYQKIEAVRLTTNRAGIMVVDLEGAAAEPGPAGEG